MATSKGEKGRIGFVFYFEWIALLRKYPAEIRHMMRDYIDEYALNGTEPDFAGNIDRELLFATFKNQLDRDLEKYKDIQEKRREAGRKGRQTQRQQVQANDSKCQQVQANDSNIIENKGIIESETESETEIETEIETPINRGDIFTPPTPEGNPENPSLEHQARDFIKFFNERVQGTNIPKVMKVTSTRVRNAGMMLHQWGRESMEEVIIKATAPNSCFATGELTIGFDWLMNEDNAIKVLEGNYDNTRTNQQGTGMGKQEARHLEQLRQLAGGDPERLAYLEATYENRG